SFKYTDHMVLNSINFYAEKNQIISLIGPNGSGKSTLLRCLCGLIRTEKNSVFLYEKPIESLSPKEIAQKIAFLPQFHQKLQGVSVQELVSMGRSPYHKSGWILTSLDKQKIFSAMQYMQVEHLKNRPLEMLSGGEKQRAWIAMVLAQDTEFILLDEPVTYMDLRYQQDLLRVVKNLKAHFQKTVIAVFHDINHAIEVSDFVYLLKDGHIHNAGTSEDVITEKNIKDVYGICTHICRFKKCRRRVVVPAEVDNF
ncbi:MAG TPA: ABC transporter ATP-binding protein, partial [Petrotogaceae bacterium]|nr:ABC transporter ATP-binding protein [Petrotogaceae bacterium]